MEEQIKLDSLKDVLVELQKLQLEYHGKYIFGITQYNDDTIKVWLDNMDEYYDWISKNYSFSKITIEECQKCLQKFNFSYNFEKSKLEKYKFIPEYLKKFYYINQFGVISSKTYCDKWKQFPKSRNCFSSQKDAKEFLKHIEKFYEL